MQAYFVAIRASATTQVRALRVRLERTTQRERLMLGGLALAVFLYAPIAALEWRGQQRDDYVEALTERSAARLALASARRVAADPAGQAVLDDMNSWGFEASNIAVAKVRIEQRLLEAATGANLANPRITTDDEIEAVGPVQWLGAQVQADLSWAGVFGFLDALTGWPEGFQMTGFTYRLEPPPANPNANLIRPAAPGAVTLEFTFPVELADAEPAS